MGGMIGFAGSKHDSYIFDSSLFNMRFADSQQEHPTFSISRTWKKVI